MPDESIRHYGQVEITVKADPIIGNPPAWANTIEIADECIAIVKRRHDAEKAAEEQLRKDLLPHE